MTIQLKIKGMTCGHCVRTVSGALKGVKGVTGAEVDLKGGTATVEGAPDPAALVAAVEAEGYQAEVRL
ncbi:MAG: heavy-metal-associated domain-containing protein [Acidobacteria bacterium]|nr:heavy-metal-associated domain-containing protein [Acidobacteriota bacterium]